MEDLFHGAIHIQTSKIFIRVEYLNPINFVSHVKSRTYTGMINNKD